MFMNASIFARLMAALPFVVLTIFSFFYGIGSTLLFDWDEGAFSEATREMLADGNYLTTYLNGEYRSAKPILIYWLQAGAATIFGINELAMRLPSAICASLWALALFLFVRRVCDARTARVAALVMLGALQISIIGRAAISDALLNLWISSAMFCLFLHDRVREGHLSRNGVVELLGGRTPTQMGFALGAFTAMGLGTLTKGPIAFIIPGVVSLLYFLSLRRLRAWFQFWLNIPAILLYVCVTGPWFVLQYLDQGQAFIDGFFLKHNVGRFTDAMEGHGGGPYYYLVVLTIGLLPSTVLLWKPLRSLPGFARRLWSSGNASPEDELRLFAWLWFGFVLVFFTFAGTKLPHYVIYGYPGLLVLMALDHAHAADHARSRWLYLPPALFAALICLLPEITGLMQPHMTDAFSQAVLAGVITEFDATFRLASVIAFLSFAALALWPETQSAPGESRLSERRLFLAGLAMTSLLNFAVMPVAMRGLQAPVHTAAQIAKEREEPVVFWKFYWPSFLFYYGDQVPVRLPRPGELVLMKSHELKYLKEHEPLFEQNGVVLTRLVAMDDMHYVRMMLE